MLTIGALAKATGTKAETIRWYEREGILPAPGRTGGNYRSYGPEHVERLGFVRRCRDLGFSLDEVRELLALADRPERDCREVDRLTAAHLAAVERKIADLRHLADELRRISGRCPGGTVAACRIIEALAHKPGTCDTGKRPRVSEA
jgi:Cu(I)-responsive transcriptional regulator